jgi:GT2 family glycosyltransferase
MSSLVVVIVTFNNQSTITACLKSISKNTLSSLKGLVVVDNASSDQTIQTIENLAKKISFPIKTYKNHQNVGFAKAANQGLRLAEKIFSPDSFFLFNPDAQLKQNCLKKLLQESFQEPSLGLVSPFIYQNNFQKTSWFIGGRLSWVKLNATHVNCPLKSQYLTGCALLIKKEVLQKIGYLDEHFFLYYEDADFSLRAQQAGYSLRLVPKAICYHQESHSFSSAKLKNYYLVKSGLLFFYKHYPLWALPYFWGYFWLRFSYHQLFSHKKLVLQAMQDFLQEYRSVRCIK